MRNLVYEKFGSVRLKEKDKKEEGFDRDISRIQPGLFTIFTYIRCLTKMHNSRFCAQKNRSIIWMRTDTGPDAATRKEGLNEIFLKHKIEEKYPCRKI